MTEPKRVVFIEGEHEDTIHVEGGSPIRVDNLTIEGLLDLLTGLDVINLSKIYNGE